MTQDDASRRRYLTAVGGASLAALGGCLGGGAGDDPTNTEDAMDDEDMTEEEMTEDGKMATTFEVAVENVSTGDTLETMDGSVAVPLSPGVYAVHSGTAGLFTPGEAAGDGLEALAEDGAPGTLAEEVEGSDGVLHGGAFTTPDGADDPAPLLPGDTYAFEVEASGDADRALSLATMFVQSNDLFYAPAPGGVALFKDGEPVEGDVTDAFDLWDAGTEQNQPPGEGDDQAPRQSEAGAGTEEMASVRAIDDVDDGFEYPAVEDVLRVTVTTM